MVPVIPVIPVLVIIVLIDDSSAGKYSSAPVIPALLSSESRRKYLLFYSLLPT